MIQRLPALGNEEEDTAAEVVMLTLSVSNGSSPGTGVFES
jgi:hypothetical protein